MSRRTVALVTGANRGLGFEVARQLGQRGDEVWAGCRRPDTMHTAESTLRGEGLAVRSVHLDLDDLESVDAACHRIGQESGALDVLVNNAAGHFDPSQRAVDADLGTVADALGTNLIGTWRVVQAALPLLRESSHARIVNVSSRAASLSGMEGGMPAYRVSKTALNALTRMLADELAHEGILVNSVCPGRTATGMVEFDGRPVELGAAGIVWTTSFPDEGPTGGFFRDKVMVPW